MKDYELLKAMGKIRPDYIEEAARPKKRGSKTRLSRAGQWAVLAAGLALAVLLGINVPKLFQLVSSAEMTPAQETTPVLTLPENSFVFFEVIPAAEESAVLTLPAETPDCLVTCDPEDWEKIREQGMDPDLYQSFDTFQEFEEAEKKREGGMTEYYIPALLGEKCSLLSITKREGVFLTTSYQVFTQTIHPDANTAYEKELAGIILCTQYLFSVTDETISCFQNCFQVINYNNRVYYYTESRSLDKSALLGYEIVFIIDQTAFHIHLPAVNSFEEMMEFTELEKHGIK